MFYQTRNGPRGAGNLDLCRLYAPTADKAQQQQPQGPVLLMHRNRRQDPLLFFIHIIHSVSLPPPRTPPSLCYHYLPLFQDISYKLTAQEIACGVDR